ncbi:MAG: DUF1223 domain-containing protein [Burkholderiales bacterium]
MAAVAALALPAHAVECSARSSSHRVALLELYTSEGCSSCPPADRWLGALRDRGVREDQTVALAFHVDYWDYIGWKDRFAQPAFAARQRLVAARNDASFIYTPQFVLDGRDLRRPWLPGTLDKRLAAINRADANFDISATLEVDRAQAALSVHARNNDRDKARFFVALYENGLSTEVKAGENAGKRLYHQFVVRVLEGPLIVEPGVSLEQQYRFDLSAYPRRANLGIALFAENGTSGNTMQAMALPVCTESR